MVRVMAYLEIWQAQKLLEKSENESKELERQIKEFERIQFERLQHKSIIPTLFLKELIDRPSSWELAHYFFKLDHKEHDKNECLIDLINKIELIAIESYREVLAEKDYEIDMQSENPIMYSGFGFEILREHNEIFSEIQKIKKIEVINFFDLCKCIAIKANANIFLDKQQYEEVFYCVTLAGYIFGNSVKKLDIKTDFQILKSKENKQKARQRWGDKVEQQRQRYLQHYKEKGFTTYKACALWIWENDNPEQLDLDTIKIHLSKADKEQAKQKQNKIEKK